MVYCHAAEISGVVYYVTCCYAAEISGTFTTLHVATLLRSLGSFTTLLESDEKVNSQQLECQK